MLARRWDAGATGPIVGKLFCVDDLIVFGCGDGVCGLDRLTGRFRWLVELEGGVAGAIGVCGTTIVVGSDDGVLSGLSFDGETKWTHRYEGSFRVPPVCLGRTTLFYSECGECFEIELPSGSRAPPRFPTTGEPTIAECIGSILFVCKLSGALVAYDLNDGAMLWETPSEGSISRVAVERQTLLVPGFDGVVARNITSGREIWRLKEERANIRGVGCGLGCCVFGWRGRARAVALDSGRVLWDVGLAVPCEDEEYHLAAAPMVVGKLAWCVSHEGGVFALEMEGGGTKHAIQVPDPEGIVSGPLVVDDLVVIASYDGGIEAFSIL